MHDQADFESSAALSDERVRLVERVAPLAVALGGRRHRFTGIAWRPGLVVTADEALPEGDEVPAPAGSASGSLTVVGRDASTDVALLRTPDGRAMPVTGFATGTPPLGASILVVAAGPDGPVLAAGIVSSVGPEWRSLRGGRIDARVELDVRLPRIAEGAPVFDARGALLGMAVPGARRRTLLIPGSTIERVADVLARDGRVARGRIGAALQAIALDGGGRGLVVASVEEDGPAKRAGLHQGDLVVRVNGEEPRGLRGLLSRLGPGSVGDTLALTVRRGGEDREIAVGIEERPRDRRRE